MPAVGFGMGDVVLAELLKERGLALEATARVDVTVIPVGPEMARPARQVTSELRRRGISVETPYSPAGVSKDLRVANQARARFAVVVGPEEWSAGEVNLKDLRSGRQRRLPLENLAEAIRHPEREGGSFNPPFE